MKESKHSDTILYFVILSLFMAYAWFRMDNHYDKALEGTKLQQQRSLYSDKSAF